MQKSATYRLLALGLAFLMLSTSTGLALDLHICQGKVKSFSVFGKAKGCYELKPAAMSCAHRDVVYGESFPSFNRPPCCQNEYLLFQSDADRVQVSATSIDISQSLQATTVGGFIQVLPVVVENTLWKRYKPPSVAHNLTLLYRVLLI